MQGSDIAVLVMVVGAFTLFGCVLGFASFEESRARWKKEKNENRHSRAAD